MTGPWLSEDGNTWWVAGHLSRKAALDAIEADPPPVRSRCRVLRRWARWSATCSGRVGIHAIADCVCVCECDRCESGAFPVTRVEVGE